MEKVVCEICKKELTLSDGETVETLLAKAREEQGEDAIDDTNSSLYLVCDDCVSVDSVENIRGLLGTEKTDNLVTRIRDEQIRLGEQMVYRQLVRDGLVPSAKLVTNPDVRKDVIDAICPFHDSTIHDLELVLDPITRAEWVIHCKVCNCFGPSCDTEENAMQSWNLWCAKQKQVLL